MTEKQNAKLELYEQLFESYIAKIEWYYDTMTTHLREGDYYRAKVLHDKGEAVIRMLDELTQKTMDSIVIGNEWSSESYGARLAWHQRGQIEKAEDLGEWLFDSHCYDYVCSECGKHAEYTSSYCPNCGKKLKPLEGRKYDT